jgi:glycosyltransferase involved in cell wall biosynthesis
MLVTVSIPFYNPGSVFIHSINSVLLQTYSKLEILLVNDGSTDGSLDLALSITDPRVKVINDNVNKGLNYRLNQITDIATGEYLARMDADDLMALDRIEKQVQFLFDNPKLDLVTSGLCSIDTDFNILGFRGPKEGGIDKDLTFESLLFGTKCPIHASLLAKKSWCKRNCYNDKYKRIEDYYLWLTAFEKGDLNIGFMPDYLYYYEESNSINPKNLSLAYKNQYQLVTNEFANNVFIVTRLKFRFFSLIKQFLIKFEWIQSNLLNNRHNLDNSESFIINSKIVKHNINIILNSKSNRDYKL